MRENIDTQRSIQPAAGMQSAGTDQSAATMQSAGDVPEREQVILSTVVLAVLFSGPFLIGALIWLAELLSWGTAYTTAGSTLGALLLACIGVAILAGLFLSMRQRLRELRQGESELARAKNY